MSETRYRRWNGWWTSRRARTLGVAATAALVLVTACGGDSSTGPGVPKSPVGNYTVATVNGKALPFTIFSDTGFKYEETAGTLALTSDGKYSFVTTFRQTVESDVEVFVDSTFGRWTQSGASLSFVDALDSTSTATATWAAPQLTFTLSDSGATSITIVYALKP